MTQGVVGIEEITAMISVGESLRRERLKRNLELGQISNELKIALRFLEAIESEHFEKLPGRLFAKNFVRQYARMVDLDDWDTPVPTVGCPGPCSAPGARRVCAGRRGPHRKRDTLCARARPFGSADSGAPARQTRSATDAASKPGSPPYTRPAFRRRRERCVGAADDAFCYCFLSIERVVEGGFRA
jgi:hypothetical protein